MRFSYSAIWDEAVRLLKGHASLLIAIAGVFLFLPELLVAYWLPAPEAKSWTEVMQLMTAYLETNWPALLAVNVIAAAGSIAMLLLLFDRGGISVAEALRRSLPLLLPYVAASFLANLMIFSGLIFLLVPGLYLAGRLATVAPALVAEGLRNPAAALRRGFEMTQGRGWAVFGLIILIFFAGSLVVLATSSVIGALLLLAGGQQVGALLSLILDAALGAGLTTVMLTVYAAIYLQLSGARDGGSGDRS